MFQAEADLESFLLEEERLGEIKAPVDLLWGESDRYLGRTYPERLLAGLPRSRLTWIPQCGHLPQAECPSKFVAQLKEVLTQNPPAPREASFPKNEGESP
jgi:pimeloyl-ACP methyl ester carboxylesterase